MTRKILTASQLAKDALKVDRYKREKDPLESIGKKSRRKSTKPRKQSTCGICGVLGHTRHACLQPGGGAATKNSNNGGGSRPSFFDALK